MCQITEIQLAGDQFDASGTPTALEVSARLSDCRFVDIEIFRTASDDTPLFSASGVEADPASPPPQRLAFHSFTVTAGNAIQCGDLLWVRVSCSTDGTCRLEDNVRVECKGFDEAECPTEGPALDVQPPVDQLADCLAAGSYTVTLGGTWPAGTVFNWKLGDIPPGTTSPTGNHSDTFTLDHPAGSPARILISEVEVPGCGDVESVVFFPPGQAVSCPDTVTFEISGPGPTQTLTWTTGQPPLSADNLPPGDYTIRVTSPADSSLEFEWYRDNAFIPAGAVPAELEGVDLAEGATTTVAVRLKPPCCTPLLVPLILGTPAAGGGTTGPGDGEAPPPPPPPAPNPFCAIWNAVVGVALIAGLLTLIATACAPFSAATLLFSIGGIAVAIGVAILLLLICGPNGCGILGTVAWSLKWSILLGALISLTCFSIASFFLVLVLGMTVAAIIWWLANNGCTVPAMLSWP